MLIDPARLREQIALGEDSNLELKEVRFRGTDVAGPRRDALPDEMAAFANAHGGRLVLGVRDDRRPKPLEPPELDALVRLVGASCAASITPPVDCRVSRVAAGTTVLVVNIPEGSTVHRFPGGYFRRHGDSTRCMEEAEVRRLPWDRGQSRATSTDTPVVGTAVNTLRRDLWRRYASSRVDDSDEIALTKHKFAKTDSGGRLRATVGGVLLASEDPRRFLPNAWIQAVCYRGTRPDASRQLDAREITGPLDRQFRDPMRFMTGNRRIAAYRDPARTDVPPFSARAVFKAVVHRDYAVSRSRIRLFMFDDRLELYSPGGLGNSMSTEDLRTSQFTRKELIASGLGQCDAEGVAGAAGRKYFIERRGEGIGVIQEETFALACRPPLFELIGKRELKVVLPAARPPVAEGVAAQVSVTSAGTDAPLPGVHVLVLYPNKTYREARTDTFGRAEFLLHARLPRTIFCAADGFDAHVVRNYTPNGPLEVCMTPVPDGGSQIIAHRTGRVACIRGRLNPILDNLNRMYLYADSIAVNDGQAQPVHFRLSEPVHLTDALGAGATLWFREILGASCVFDHRHDGP